MHYIFSIPSQFDRFVSIEMQVNGPFTDDFIDLQLPSWRPGRYELGNFAKNIKGFDVIDDANQQVKYHKVSKDCWRVYAKGPHITVKYKYYANQLDGGACWVNHDQLYINPIHCCFFIPGRENEKCHVKLNVPLNWKLATGMKMVDDHNCEATGFEQLLDSPFIASPSLQHATYNMDGINFNIWIQGDCNPDWNRIIKDFEGFTRVQLNMMKEFPVSDFHFLIQILPFPFYHGVEHLTSTVLAMGPGYNFMKPAFYSDFMGVASHELFHVWNVKFIRPAEMHPYNYTKENYAETGYVYEGVTTYYGDLFLGRSGFFSLDEMLAEFSTRLQKHIDNPGRFNYSVAESSFDTWLDGYVPGVPGRKVSIYDEGCLVAWIMDFMIRLATESKKSLDNVMQVLYFDYAKNDRGYTSNDFREIVEFVGARSFENFFNDYVYKAASLETLLSEVVSLAGLSLELSPAPQIHERVLGLKIEIRNGATFITTVYPGSPANVAGLVKDDEIVAVNNTRVENNLSELVENITTGNGSFLMLISTSKKVKSVSISVSSEIFFSKVAIKAEAQITHSQLQFRQAWLNQ